jgi:hypothetical protein
MPTTASNDIASAALEELTEALKNPAAAKPFLKTGNKLNAAIEALTEILSTNRGTTPSSSGASPPRVSERTMAVRTPRVDNDPKHELRPKITPQVAVRGLNKIISTCATTRLNSTNNIKKATSIPTKLVNNSTDNINISDNNNISGVNNVTPSGKNSEENSPRSPSLKFTS